MRRPARSRCAISSCSRRRSSCLGSRNFEIVLTDGLRQLERLPGVADTRVAGLLGGISLAEDISAERVTDALVDEGFVTRPLRGNTIQISPPFITTDDELRDLLGAIEIALSNQDGKL
ncbi:aminotransferase class III-fold pyridoxal phosphate-dependent enzyme [Rhodococcus opacus]|uniref:aminotransferase class III-fold pyridoxal phosphate-dependent enzyme n=1 Tax=Rhodococcus opacus TaxID=37919 RepID=UPI0034D1A5A9